MDINKLLCEVLSICHQISVKSDADVFFDYSPHINGYCVSYHDHGWQNGVDDKIWVDMGTHITVENLEATIAKLRAYAKGKGVELYA